MKTLCGCYAMHQQTHKHTFPQPAETQNVEICQRTTLGDSSLIVTANNSEKQELSFVIINGLTDLLENLF